jgi:hypothetical protein
MKNICLGLLLLATMGFARDWSMYIYMVADNDLAQWADSDLVELQEIGSTDDVAVIVQVDKPTIGARRVFVLKGTVQEKQNLGVIDMCAWQTLADFLEWGIINYPAQKHCLVLWDHGTGWTMIPEKTFGYDGSSGSRMSIANGDLRKAISSACDHTGEKIDIVAFDACLMQQIEVACELSDHASIMVGLQSVCPLAGLRYDMILDSLVDRPNMSTADLAKKIVSTTIAHYTNIQPLSCSAVRVSALATLTVAMRSFVNSVKESPPGRQLVVIRDSVQTIPVSGTMPDPDNLYVDLGDWLARMNSVVNTKESRTLYDSYCSTILHTQSWGSGFSNTSGLSVWFPYTYPEFKQLIDSYTRLAWNYSSWASFLNWFYDSDDIRPTQVTLSSSEPGSNNDFRLSWSESFDLADRSYAVIECSRIDTIFYDPCEDTVNWDLNGFTLSDVNVYSGNYSFFSGNVGNVYHTMTTKQPYEVDAYGFLTWYMWHNTEDMVDSLAVHFGSVEDIHYGRSGGWIERRVLLPPGYDILTVSYSTNVAINNGGCYIDDIRMYYLYDGRFIRHTISDTSLYVFNKEQGSYFYYIRPEDRYGNFGNVSLPILVNIKEYAVPCANPNPFQEDCVIVLDYPDSLQPSVEIFSLVGRVVRRFTNDRIIDKTVYWDGKDSSGQEVGSGLYFVLVKDGKFKKIGKIARQR